MYLRGKIISRDWMWVREKHIVWWTMCVCVLNIHEEMWQRRKKKKERGRKWSTLSEQGICECKINDEISNALWITQKRSLKIEASFKHKGRDISCLTTGWDFCSWFPPRLSPFYSSNDEPFYRKLHSISSKKSNFSSSHPLFIFHTCIINCRWAFPLGQWSSNRKWNFFFLWQHTPTI